MSSELVLNLIELYAELNSASIGTTFDVGRSRKSATYTQSTNFFRFLGRVFCIATAILAELSLKVVEWNSA